MRSRSFAVATATLTFFSLAACGGDNTAEQPASTTDAGTTEPSAPDAGDDAGPGVISGHGAIDGGVDAANAAVDAGPTPCPSDALPTANPCVVDEAFGVFVVANAAAGGDGTRAKPFAALAGAITAAKAAKKRVYACAGTYAEAIEIQNGVSMFGNFECASNVWTVSAQHATVKPATSPAARATGITVPTRIEGIDFTAPDFGGLAADVSQTAKSSIGLLASNATALSYVGGTIHAGSAQRGADGVAGVAVVQTAEVSGYAALEKGLSCAGPPLNRFCQAYPITDDGGSGGGASACRTSDASTVDPALGGGPGGQGGHGSRWGYVDAPVPGQPGQTARLWLKGTPPGAGQPVSGSALTAAGGAAGAGTTLNAGSPGAVVAAGTNGASGTVLGSLTAAGVAASDGAPGVMGRPGQGGGGGGGYDTAGGDVLAAAQSTAQSASVPFPDVGSGATGSGGGAGGCAGVKGAGGRGGGSSVAVVSLDSAVRFELATLETGVGGTGGRGGVGSVGTAGGAGGSTVHANPGGAGSAGSAGSSGGSGRGGHSIAVAYTGVLPTITNPTYRLGAAGAGAPAFTSPTGTVAASLAGVQAQTQKF